MKETFSRRFVVASNSENVWRTLLDVPRIASWLTIVSGVDEVNPRERYRAVLEDRMGPFRLHADLDIKITELAEGSHLRAEASGEDRQVSSRITVEGILRTAAEDGGIAIALEGSYEVTGRVATLGAGSIRKKADRLLEDFCQNAIAQMTS
jgi:uncharacterized protein